MLELAEVVRDLRTELMLAMAAGAHEALQFDVGTVDLELTVAVKKEGDVNAKVKFYVFEVGAAGKVEAASTQKLTLHLNPKVASTGESPRISGVGMPGEQ